MFLSVQSVFRPTSADLANTVTRISTAAGGAQASGDSVTAQFSPDGRSVLFVSWANNLVAGDTNDTLDIFLKDLSTGAVTRVSTAANGAQADSGSYRPQFSPDGRYAVFESDASNLVAGDSNGRSDIFLKDLSTGVVTRLSTAANSVEANSDSSGAQLSPDGRYVVFESDASNLVAGDSNGRSDIFLKDLSTGVVTRLSTAANGSEANSSSYDARFSPDGRYAVFESDASNLVAGDSNGRSDIFLKDLSTGVVTRLSTAANGTEANGGSGEAQFSPDGRYVVYESFAPNLVTGDSNGSSDIFLKDLSTGAVTRLSAAADGAQANAGSGEARFSPDGRYVVFESLASNLVAGDSNNSIDIFLKDLSTGAVTRLSTAANGTEASTNNYGAQFSPDGRYVVFESSASNLVAGDSNNSTDIFRVDLLHRANAAAIAESRFVETTLAVGSAASASIAWGDGTTSTQTPVAGKVALHHAYASTGVKAATVTLVEGALTWNVAHTIDLGAGTMVRNTVLADTLSGGAGADSLTGDGFANILIGGAGNDRLSASAGADRLSGGLGQDRLTGGTGRDVFAFDDRESASSKSKADYVLDFSRRQGDKIDLSAIDANTKKRGDQKFTFIGDDKSFGKAGEVRFEKTKSATYVYLNTDSDRSAEAVIKLKGALELQKSWFVL